MSFLFRSVFVVIVLNILGVFALIGLLSPQKKVDLRSALFSSEVEQEFFGLPPDALRDRGFKWFSELFRARFLSENAEEVAPLIDPGVSEGVDPESVKKMVLEFSKNGIEGGCGDFSGDLIKNILWIMRGFGCCSDHSQVFIALSLIQGIGAREVHNIGGHTFNEYWDKGLNKWIWVDPQYALMATDSNGNYLGILEIQKLIADREPVNWDFFGTSQHVLSRVAIEDIAYYKPSSFKGLQMTLGNNVFQEDLWNHRLSFLPREIVQGVLLVVGIKPGYAYYDHPDIPGDSTAARLSSYRLLAMAWFGVNLVGGILALLFFRRRGATLFVRQG